MNACEVYEGKFNSKINAMKNHPKFSWLRKYADDAINYHTGVGCYQIKADDFMDRIIAAPINIIESWLDGKNQLEWNTINRIEA